MHHPLKLTGLSLLALLLCACERTPPVPLRPAEPQIRPASSKLVAQSASGVSNPSVPAADTVPGVMGVTGAPATATKPEPTAGRFNGSMSRAQESSAMPMPGQANDHSAPLTPPKASSGPRRD
ncbi:hypothetical protein LNV08_16565 [Paucibacter sp. TC2R-5]|uniref:hypothetical protein n=1 Tax=Paucibacter sp. TC2R-5 TaxID=2893555 RepID=UPI0021E46753|nr:hypothetical protein [Paucibacter sp. TC2R-5]MCV2360589.1 hypothetical protein [Paucibacter sp. TC2R-5]